MIGFHPRQIIKPVASDFALFIEFIDGSFELIKNDSAYLVPTQIIHDTSILHDMDAIRQIRLPVTAINNGATVTISSSAYPADDTRSATIPQSLTVSSGCTLSMNAPSVSLPESYLIEGDVSISANSLNLGTMLIEPSATAIISCVSSANIGTLQTRSSSAWTIAAPELTAAAIYVDAISGAGASLFIISQAISISNLTLDGPYNATLNISGVTSLSISAFSSSYTFTIVVDASNIPAGDVVSLLTLIDGSTTELSNGGSLIQIDNSPDLAGAADAQITSLGSKSITVTI